MRRVYQCDTCEGTHNIRESIYQCLHCGREICEKCVVEYMHCKYCHMITPVAIMEKRFEEANPN